VTVLSAPPGSGKTVLLRSWISQTGLGERAAWVLAGRDERDAQRFWLSVLGALRQTVPGSALVIERARALACSHRPRTLELATTTAPNDEELGA
jgi:LuxR family maltose regulon positive regulatory protein